MKTKSFFLTFISLTCMCLLAWGQAAGSAKSQFILIIRSKADPQFSQEVISVNIKHWQEYMGSLGQSGQLSGGYRPGNEGDTNFSLRLHYFEGAGKERHAEAIPPEPA